MITHLHVRVEDLAYLVHCLTFCIHMSNNEFPVSCIHVSKLPFHCDFSMCVKVFNTCYSHTHRGPLVTPLR